LFEVLASTPFCQPCPQFAFPDFARVRITRLDPTTRKLQDFTVDVQTRVESGDCKQDMLLEWGDLVDIPESEHKLNEPWTGLSREFATALAKCVDRSVFLTVKGNRHVVSLKASAKGLVSREGQSPDYHIQLPTLRLRETVLGSGLVLTSSDLSRVSFSRSVSLTSSGTHAKTGTMIANLEQKDSPGSDIWLLEGDSIEVPEKGQ
jgi:hypothetical protein